MSPQTSTRPLLLTIPHSDRAVIRLLSFSPEFLRGGLDPFPRLRQCGVVDPELQPMPRMITFKCGGFNFSYRVAAVVTNGRRVLLHKAEDWMFWVLPGGRCELYETAA